jgi:hypothetical protein
LAVRPVPGHHTQSNQHHNMYRKRFITVLMLLASTPWIDNVQLKGKTVSWKMQINT